MKNIKKVKIKKKKKKRKKNFKPNLKNKNYLGQIKE